MRPRIGVFDERNDAELAARELREKGFKDDQIGYAWRDDAGKTHQEGNKAGEMAASGAGTGVVLGGLIGAGAALLTPGIGPVVPGGLLATALAGAATGAVAGGVAGGVSGALVGLGIPETAVQMTRGTKGSIGVDGTYVYLAIVTNATVTESAYVLQALGAKDGLNVDGGGTSAMYIAGSYKVGPGRLLPNAIVLTKP